MLLVAVGEGDDDLTKLSAALDRSQKRNVNDGRCFVSSLNISVLLIIIAFSSPSHTK